MNPQRVEEENFQCQECHAVIGQLVQVGTEMWLQTGMVEVRFLHGRCTACRHVYHFDARKQAELMKEKTRTAECKK